MSLFRATRYLHLEGYKNLSKDKEILFLDDKKGLKVYFPCLINNKQIKVLVNEGDNVYLGQKIAERTDFYVPIYSSVSGIVLNQEEVYCASLKKKINHIVIESDGLKIRKELLKIVDENDSKEDILLAIKEAGLVGMGGAGFPTYYKYCNAININTLLINGVECEPFLTTDYVAIKNNVKDLINGCKLLMKVCGAEKTVIAIKVHKELIKKIIEEELVNENKIFLVEVKDVYPMGWERLLIKEIFNLEYDKLPNEVGIVSNNVQTVITLNKVLTTGKPPSRRIVTVSGNAINNARNVSCIIGTLANEIINKCGEIEDKNIYLISGGVMCSNSNCTDLFPISLPIGALTLIKDKKYIEEPCLRCGSCTKHCPSYLQPVEIRNALKSSNYDRLMKLNVFACVECGVCSYCCPSKIELTESMKNAKKVVKIKMNYLRKEK